jgi:hypothetical protein
VTAPRWEPDFDFWSARLDDTPAQMFLDMAAAQHAPLLSHPVRLQVRVALKEPSDDGLLAEDEAEALYAVEDAISARLSAALDAVFVGRLVAEGRATFAFYLPRGSARRADEETGKLVAGAATPYAVQWRVEDDAEWAYYRELLYPDEEAKQEMLSRRARDKVLGVTSS